MRRYIVRFSQVPTAYSKKEALLVEADSPINACLIVEDMLIRRGDDPKMFAPTNRAVRCHREIGHPRFPDYAHEPQNAESTRQRDEALTEAVSLYEPPPPGRVIGVVP